MEIFLQLLVFVTLLCYTVVVSQSFSYIIAIKNVHENLSAEEYIVTRKLTDRNFRAKFKYVFYATLISSTLLCIVSAVEGSALLITGAIVAWVCFVLDAYFMVKGNLPINAMINNWEIGNYPADWKTYRKKWLDVFMKRQVANITGFVVLLAAVIFS
jgi:hypothetical protein